MEFGFTEEQDLLRESVIKLMERHAPPELIRQHDRERSFPEDLYKAWVDAGLLRLAFPEQYGGLGGSAIDLSIVVYELSRVSADLTMAFAGSIFCGLNVWRMGNEEQKAYWLPKVMDGEVKLAIGISEPAAGSDVGALKTKAEREGDHYLVNGQKLWTTAA